MKRIALAAIITAASLTAVAGEAWSRVVVLPRRRVVVRTRPVYVHPDRRVVYYRPCKRVVYLPPPSTSRVHRCGPRRGEVEEVEIDVEVEVDD